MKVFRFMSNEEFKKYKEGQVLENNTKHSGKTNSIGFCFFKIKDFTPEEAMHFLSGIASFDICAIFETKKKLNKTYGVYAGPIEKTGYLFDDFINLLCNFDKHFTATEYCTKKYSKADFRLIKYSENIWSQWNIIDHQKELVWKEE